MKLWIDTDLGTDVDDALALAYALNHPDIELVGVSTVFGDVGLRTRMVSELLRIAGRPDVPVVTGLGKPLSPDRDGMMFGHEGIGLLEDPSHTTRTESDPNPDERIHAISEALGRSGAEAMLAIGPMTNLGALARAGVDLPPLTVMGGKTEDVELPGAIAGIAEWNWYCDPEAVALTLASAHDVRPRIVPIDVTCKTALAAADVDTLSRGSGLARVLATLCRQWLTELKDRLGMKLPKIALHDPLALATMLKPGLCSFEDRSIRVDATGFGHRDPEGAAVCIAADVDNEVLRSHLMDILTATNRDG